MTDHQISTLPKSRRRKLANVATRQGVDIAHLRLLDIEAFRPCMDAVQRFSTYGKGSSLDDTPVVSKKGQRINTYLVHNKQFNAACQMASADDPNTTFAQRLARTNMLIGWRKSTKMAWKITSNARTSSGCAIRPLPKKLLDSGWVIVPASAKGGKRRERTHPNPNN